MDNNTDDVDDNNDNQTHLTTVHITQFGKNNTTNGTTNVENGDNQTSSNLRQIISTIVMLHTKSSDEIGLIDETRNGTSIPTENETTKGDHYTQIETVT